MNILEQLLFWRLPAYNALTGGPDHVLTFIIIGITMIFAFLWYHKIQRPFVVSIIAAFLDGMIIASTGVWLSLFFISGASLFTPISFPIISEIPLVVLILIAVGIRFLYLADSSMFLYVGLWIVVQLPAFLFWRYALHSVMDFVGHNPTQYWLNPWVVLWGFVPWCIGCVVYYVLMVKTTHLKKIEEPSI